VVAIHFLKTGVGTCGMKGMKNQRGVTDCHP
jgi:hypothetical protein